MAVAFDAVGPSSSGAISSSATTLSWTHTVGPVASPLVVVGIDVDATSDTGMTSTVTYGGTAMTSLGKVESDATTQGYLQVYWLAGIPTGASTVAVTVSGGTPGHIVGGSLSFANAGGVGTPATFSVSGNTSEAITLVSDTSGNLIAGFIAASHAITATSSPATSRFNNSTVGNAGFATGNLAGATTAATGGNDTLTWTALNAQFAALAVEILPVTTGVRVVQTKAVPGDGSATTLSGSFGSPTTAGNCIIVCPDFFSSTAAALSVTAVTLGGSAGNFGQLAFAQSAAGTANVLAAAIWANPNCAGGQTSVSVTVAGGSAFFSTIGGFIAYEVAGLPSTFAALLDQLSTGSGTTGTTDSSGSTPTTTSAGDIIFGNAGTFNNITTDPAGYTNTPPVASGYGGEAGYQIPGTTGTFAYSVVQSGSATWASVVVALFPAGMGSASPLPMSRPGLSRLRAHHGVSRQQQYQVFQQAPDATAFPATLAITTSVPAPGGLSNTAFPATLTVTTTGPAPAIADDNVTVDPPLSVTTALPADFTVTATSAPPTGIATWPARPGLSRLRAHHGVSRQQQYQVFLSMSDANPSPAALAVTTAVPAVIIADSNVTTAALAVTAAVPADLAVVNDNVTVAPVTVTVAFPFASVMPSPPALAVTAAFPPASVVSDNVTVAPAAVTASYPAVTIATGETASPAVLAATASFPQAIIANDNIRFLNPAITVTTSIPLPQVGPPVSPVLEAFGFAPFAGIIPSSPIVSVTVSINQFASSALMGAPTFELWDGFSGPIGATQTGTATTSSANVDTATFTGPISYTQLATLRVRIRATKGTATTGATETVNWVSLTVTYVELVDTAQASGIASVTVYPREIVAGAISTTASPATIAVATFIPPVKALVLDVTVLPAVLAAAGAYPVAAVATGLIVSAVTLAILTAEPAPAPADNTSGPDYATGGDVTGAGQGSWAGVPTGPPGTSSAVWTVP